MPKFEGGGKKSGEEKNKLLKDVETINKALDREKSSSVNSTSSKSADKSCLHDPKSMSKDKKSRWSWKPLEALSLTRGRRFKCSFSLHVHLIEGLPSSFNDSFLCVYWKRKDVLLVTPPAKVIQGAAEFQEVVLNHPCSIYGSRSGPHNSAKYEAKHFLLYASMLGAPELDLGKHRVDLTRLLPLTLEELEEEKSSGKSTTSFRLSGKARGAVMNVTFGYVVVDYNSSGTRDNHGGAPNVMTSRQSSFHLIDPDVKPSQANRFVRRTGSLPSFTGHYYSSQNVDEVKDLHEVLPSSMSAAASLVDILCKEFDEEKTCSPQHDKPQLEGFKENIEPMKLAVCSTDIEKEKPEENPGTEGKTCSAVHDKPEFSMFLENIGTVEPDSCPLPDSGIENHEECEGNEFSVVDQGIEFSSNEHVNLEESLVKVVVNSHTIDGIGPLHTAGMQLSFPDSAREYSLDELNDSSRDSFVVHEFSYEKDVECTKEHLLQELESALNKVTEFETVAMESPKIIEAKSESKMRKARSLDDITESVASEFLSMLGIDHSPRGFSFETEPESPRERLLRQFEKDAESEGFSLFDFGTGNDNEVDSGYDASFESEQWMLSTGIKPPSFLPDQQKGHQILSEYVRGKQKAQMIEELETEALMRKWGLDEKTFQPSPPKDFTGFGSPIHFLPEEPLTLPPLAKGLGHLLQTKDGGFLRSMNPSLFTNSKNCGSLIMQVSNPLVMPAEMGSGIMEILQCLASVGLEKLSKQANKLMPLEDITGKTMQQISWEAKPVLEGELWQCHLQHDSVTGQDSTCLQRRLEGTLTGGLKSGKLNSSWVGNERGSEFVSLEDLTPLAMDKIEALSLEGLRIQSGMSEEDAPSNIIAQSFGDLLDIKDNSDDVDGIMGLSLTLDEWMRLDSGDIDDIDNIRKSPGSKGGLLGNNFTVALMVQLRDPLRNYYHVGAPMLALIQVERVFVPPKQKIYTCVSEAGNNNDEDDECERVASVEMKANKEEENAEEESIPQFRIAEVHVAGLKTVPHRKKLWGTPCQQQSGSRWLIANGMGKSNKNPLLKSKAASNSSAQATTKVQSGDTLWSISSCIYGTGTKWKELVALNPHIRNPNIIIPNKTIRIR
ncbi:protein PLASTID MOVEMENT IMPAIRED 1-RELATED 1-like [Abrus precatorius]|uniref:Protein PLASTID MOVEMENT IMPAIRED 1-RELATED 1-like n=1 Tax=Abrus precatorius TaxID=3816 RepID=A0A8B8MNE2_ABRPR|nr:protein PLASTID MOVEMENT IMPAIRED 1-RELATED 1-like [Abrus precatorius]